MSLAVDGLSGCIDGHMEVAGSRLRACDVDREWSEPHHLLARVGAAAPQGALNSPPLGARLHLAPLEAVPLTLGPFVELGDCIPHVLDSGQSLQVLLPRAVKDLANDCVHS